MSINKQSSVEWQFEQLSNSFEILKNTRLSFDEYFKRNLEIRKQAKAMHKEEMDKVAGDFWNEGASYMHDGQRKYNSFDDYYNETYGE